jgi:hypothetical protein
MDEKLVFRRSAARQLFEGIVTGVGSVAFLGAAIAIGTGAIEIDAKDRLIGTTLFGFFGILMGLGALTAVARGRDLRVAEVEANGVWLPEMGFLPWSEILEVRLERISGSGGRHQASREYRRLGFVPADSSLRPRASTAAVWGMARAYLTALKRIAPQLQLRVGPTAPFGVLEPEVGSDFDRLVENVRRHVPVLDAAS